MAAAVVVHLPSGPVAGLLAADGRVDVAGVTLPVVVDGPRAGRRLAKLPAHRDAHGGTHTVYALVEPYVHGALDTQGVHVASKGREHEQRGHEGDLQKQKRAGHGRKVAQRRVGRQSP